MPGHGKRSHNHYYSLDIGGVHVVSYNGEAFFWPEYFDAGYMARMYDWIEADLTQANDNRERTPWIVVHAHRPMYCVVADRQDPDWPAGKGFPPELRGRCGWEKESARRGVPSVCEKEYALGCSPRSNEDVAASYPGQIRNDPPISGGGATSRAPLPRTTFDIEELLYRHGVDLFFSGHVHDYERYYPVYNEVVRNGTAITFDRYFEPAATVHITTGSGGNPEMKRKAPLGPERGPCQSSAPWCAFQSGAFLHGRTADFTYSRITVHNGTTLEWEQVSALEGIDTQVIDRFVIDTPVHGPFAVRFRDREEMLRRDGLERHPNLQQE